MALTVSMIRGNKICDEGGRRTYRIADEGWEAVHSLVCVAGGEISDTNPYRHSNIITPRLHQSQEYE